MLPEKGPKDGKFTHRWSHAFNDMKDEVDEVRFCFRLQHEDGSSEEASLVTNFVVAIDGPSPTIRRIFKSLIRRKHAGHVVIWRTITEHEASLEALNVFEERTWSYHAPGFQNLTYGIAGEHDITKLGHQLPNFVWYADLTEHELRARADFDRQRREVSMHHDSSEYGVLERIRFVEIYS